MANVKEPVFVTLPISVGNGRISKIFARRLSFVSTISVFYFYITLRVNLQYFFTEKSSVEFQANVLLRTLDRQINTPSRR